MCPRAGGGGAFLRRVSRDFAATMGRLLLRGAQSSPVVGPPPVNCFRIFAARRESRYTLGGTLMPGQPAARGSVWPLTLSEVFRRRRSIESYTAARGFLGPS